MSDDDPDDAAAAIAILTTLGFLAHVLATVIMATPSEGGTPGSMAFGEAVVEAGLWVWGTVAVIISAYVILTVTYYVASGRLRADIRRWRNG